MLKRYDTIATHVMPHFDEILGIWLLQNFGEEQFPGIRTAKIIYWSAGRATPDGRSADDYEQNGVVAVGVGGGRFDEHPVVANGEQTEDECAATLVAKALGIEKDPELKRILEFAVKNDRKGVGNTFDLAYMVKVLHQEFPQEPEKVMGWTMQGIEAKYFDPRRTGDFTLQYIALLLREQFPDSPEIAAYLWFKQGLEARYKQQVQFLGTKQEFERAAQVEYLPSGFDRPLKLVTAVSDDTQLLKFALDQDGGRAAILIQKKSTGHVQIHTNKRYRLTLDTVYQMICRDERQVSGGNTDEKWYYHREAERLLNGSLTAPSVPPTVLSLEHINKIIKTGVRRSGNCS